jgi:pathogenesis-related protein 1
MRRIAAAALLVITIDCSSKGDSSQGGGGAGGYIGSGGDSLTTGGTISTGGQASGGVTGTGGQSVATGGAIGSGGKFGTTGGVIGSGGKFGATGGAIGSGGKFGATGGKTGGGGQASGGVTGADGGTSTQTNPLSQTLIDEFVTAHNNARSGAIVALNPTPSPALPAVSWDPILANSAYNYLVKCQSSDGSMVAHNANRSSDYVALGGSGYVGENIYAMQGGAAKPTDAVTLWMSEASSYDYATNTGDAGHYTQVVWRDSVRIGCAIVTCSAVKYSNTILCDYAPGGNISGQKPY